LYFQIQAYNLLSHIKGFLLKATLPISVKGLLASSPKAFMAGIDQMYFSGF